MPLLSVASFDTATLLPRYPDTCYRYLDTLIPPSHGLHFTYIHPVFPSCDTRYLATLIPATRYLATPLPHNENAARADFDGVILVAPLWYRYPDTPLP